MLNIKFILYQENGLDIVKDLEEELGTKLINRKRKRGKASRLQKSFSKYNTIMSVFGKYYTSVLSKYSGANPFSLDSHAAWSMYSERYIATYTNN